jgi:hypothetical protein
MLLCVDMLVVGSLFVSCTPHPPPPPIPLQHHAAVKPNAL